MTLYALNKILEYKAKDVLQHVLRNDPEQQWGYRNQQLI